MFGLADLIFYLLALGATCATQFLLVLRRLLLLVCVLFDCQLVKARSSGGCHGCLSAC